MNDSTSDSVKPVTVLHSHPVWLPLTQSWMYSLIKAVGVSTPSHIICESLENPEQFVLPYITALSKSDPLRFRFEHFLRRIRIFRQLPLYIRTASKLNPHILHSHFGNFGWRDLPIASRLSIPHVVSFYGADASLLPKQKPVWRARYAELFAQCRVILCEGPCMARQVVALGCPEQKIRVLRIGVDLSAIPYAPRSWTPGTPLHVLMASSFRPKKGIPVALRALAALKETLRITIVGDSAGDAGSEREKKLIYRTAHETGLAEKIDWLGFRSHKELLPIAQGAHLFLHPSMQASSGDNEGGAPVILTEIAASGMPIVSTRHCDIPEVIIDGETGYLARENDAYHLTACLKKWIDEPGAWSKRLAAGRRHIEEHFDLVKQAGKLETIYKSLLTNGH